MGYIAFQQCTTPFDNVKVRQAIAMAINRQALVDNFYTKQDTLATGFQPPAILGSNPNLPAIEYNPDKAKQDSPKPVSRTVSRPISGTSR